MLYFLFTSATPIKAENIQELSKIGVIIPYDAENPQFCDYGYYPQDLSKESIKLMQKHIQGLSLTKSEIPIAEIQKQAQKLQKVSEIKQGDIVYHRDYKKLPFIVTYTDDKESTIFHNMRSRPLTLSCDNNLISQAKGHELPTYKVEKPKLVLKNKVYIDCDTFSATIKEQYYQDIFITILKLKMLYLDAKVVLINPIQQKGDIVDMLGLESVYGNLLAVADKANPALIVSNSKILNYENQQNLTNDKRLKPRSYIVGRDTDSKAYLYGLQSAKKHIDEVLYKIKNKQIDKIEAQAQYSKDISIREAKEPNNKDGLVRGLRSVGLGAFATRINDIVYLIKGQDFSNG